MPGCRVGRIVVALVLGCTALLVSATGAAAAALTLSPAAGPPTTTVTVGGTGFQANGIVSVTFDTTLLGYAATNASGAFSGFNLQIPAAAAPGNHTILVRNDGAPGGALRSFLVRTNWLSWRGNAAGWALNATENQLVPAALGRLAESYAFPTTGGEALSAPIVANGVLYIHTHDERLLAYSIASRTRLFNVAAPGDLSPTVAGNLVFTTGSNAVRAFNRTTGALVWRATLGGVSSGGTIYASAPAVANGVVYVSAFLGTNPGLYAFATTCGSGGALCTPLWLGLTSSDTAGYPPPTPVIGGGKVYVHHNNVVYAFTVGCTTGGGTCPADWSTPASSNGTSAYANGVLYIPDFQALKVVRTRNGSTVWSSTAFSGTATSVALDGGRVFVSVTSAPNMVYAYPFGGCGAATCAPLDSVVGVFSGDIVLAGGTLWVQSDQELVAYDQTCLSCGRLWWASLGVTSAGAVPAIVDGVLYAATDAAWVQSFELNAGGP